MRKPSTCGNGDLELSEPHRGVSQECWKQPARYQPVASGCLCWGAMWFSACLLANVGCMSPRVTQRGHGASSMWFSTQSAWGPEMWWLHESVAAARVAASTSRLGLVCGQNRAWESLWETVSCQVPMPGAFLTAEQHPWGACLATGCPLALLPSLGSLAQESDTVQPVLLYACWRTRGCLRQVNSAIKCMPLLKEGSMQEISSPAFH